MDLATNNANQVCIEALKLVGCSQSEQFHTYCLLPLLVIQLYMNFILDAI